MGFSTISVPFFSDEIKIKEITEAAKLSDFKFEGKRLKDLGGHRLTMCTLDKIVDTKVEYILTMQNGDFIRFFG